MKTTKSTIDNSYTLTTYENGVQYVIYGSASWLVGNPNDTIGTSLFKKYFPAPSETDILYNKLIESARKIRANAGLNRGQTPSRNAAIKRMMQGRADALESKAYSLKR
jgi:hypothetical protein